MSIPKPKDRPDNIYWKATREERRNLDIEAIKEELEVYSLARFQLGRRYRLRKSLNGVPKGTCCTVTRLWPDTRIRWDKWSKSGMGAARIERCMSHDLDDDLEEE
jgi:hypothetical protein